MDINYNNYMDLDEQEMLKEEEKQIKEIQELLVTELDGIEIDEDDDSIDNDSSTNYPEDYNGLLNKPLNEDDSRYETESSNNDSNNKENDFYPSYNPSNNFVPNWAITPFPQLYNIPTNIHDKNKMQYNYSQTNNNGIIDSSINWEISLYDEMGIPQSMHNNNSVFPEKMTYTSTNEHPKILSPMKKINNVLKVITRDVGIECVPASQRELDNLELLYSARGKRIEQLQQELELEREKRIKETRICNHKITLLESELKNESNLMRRSNEELEEQRKINAENTNLITMQDEKINNLEYNIETLKDKIESCNIIIDGLNEQIAELTSSSSISRNNQKQTELLDCINRQFDTDSQRLKTEIHRLSERVDEKMNEINKLESLLDEQTENHRNQRQEWKTEFDKLLEELENEKKYSKELEKSTNHEKIEQLKTHICDLNLKNSLSEDMTKYLQDQILDLSHQLLAYEKSLNLLDKNHTISNDFNLDENYLYGKGKPNFHGSCPLLSTNELEVVDKDENKVNSDNYCCELQKQIFILIKRTHSLTNRLLDVRKINLDSKSNVKKLQKIIDDQKESNQNLQTKIAEVEKRLKEIQSGDETSVEKQLKVSLENMTAINDNLEQQCKNLRNQLTQATDSMKESDCKTKQMEEEFQMFKQIAEEDKIASMEDVKRICNNHYDNLRHQLEQSWMREKDVLTEEAKCQRDKILQDLSDAVKEVDHVKNLYIQLSQQKSNEELDRNNWNEWLEKKLDEQKRSLNQQFKKDQDILLKDWKIQHQNELHRLQTKIDQHKVLQNDKSIGTDHSSNEFISVSVETAFEMEEKSIQVENLVDQNDVINELRLTNQRLDSECKNHAYEYEKLKNQHDILNTIKLTIENENILLKSKVNLSKIPMSNQSDLIDQLIDEPGKIPKENCIPNIIRSTTPQLILEPKRKINSPPNKKVFTSKIHHQFKLLKEDLIKQLSKIPYLIPLVDNTPSNSFSLNHSESVLLSSLDSSSDIAIDEIKEQLYSFVLEVQARAASTLQFELRRSQIFAHNSLLEKMRHVIPVILSVDGQLIDIPSIKIQVLTDKIILMLDHLKANSSSKDMNQVASNRSGHAYPFSSTSTPINRKSPGNFRSHLSSINFNDKICNVSLNSTTNSNITPTNLSNQQMTLVEKRKKLKDEIAKLSEALNKANNESENLSLAIHSPFENVDRNWLFSD